MSWTLTTLAEAILKAGSHADATLTGSAANMGLFGDQSEGFICMECHTDFITDLALLGTTIKKAISDIVSSHVAMKVIAWNSRGYTAAEADMLMNMNDEIVSKGLAKLKDKVNHKLGGVT